MFARVTLKSCGRLHSSWVRDALGRWASASAQAPHLHVVDRHHWHPVLGAEPPGLEDPDAQAQAESRPHRHRNGGELRRLDARGLERPPHDAANRLLVGPAGEVRDDAAPGFVESALRARNKEKRVVGK